VVCCAGSASGRDGGVWCCAVSSRERQRSNLDGEGVWFSGFLRVEGEERK